ncbi:MAG: hypothetical protein R2712_11370 [Vicinamibacterales bacterium]
MTAIVGGLWDALLGEGRRFWIVASSDSHVHYSEATRRGSDFWPGQFHKTYVYANRTYEDMLEGLREGRVFVVAGDLITSLDVTASQGARSGRWWDAFRNTRDADCRHHPLPRPRHAESRGTEPSRLPRGPDHGGCHRPRRRS